MGRSSPPAVPGPEEDPAGTAPDWSRLHVSARPPATGEAHVVWQRYAAGPGPAETARQVIGGIRASLPGSWLREPFAILLANGRAYWWDGGSITDELLLTDRLPAQGEFAVVWDVYVVGATFDELARRAAAHLSQPIRVAITDGAGITSTLGL